MPRHWTAICISKRKPAESGLFLLKKIWKIYGKGVDIVALKCYTIIKLRIYPLGYERKERGKRNDELRTDEESKRTL